MSDDPIQWEKIFKNQTLRLDNMIGIGRYLGKWRGQLKQGTTLEDGRIEIWRKMIISSQKVQLPPKQKGYEYDEVSGEG